MNAQRLQPSQPIVRRNNTQRVWWVGLGLALAAAAAVSFAIYEAPAQAPLDQPVEVHLITAVNAQSVRAHPNLPPTRRSSRVLTAPGAVSHIDYVPAHSTGLSGRPSSAPGPTTRSLLAYLQPPSLIAVGQAVPDAATQGVLQYLQVHAPSQ